MTTKNLAEAAAEVLSANLSAKMGAGEKFGLGKSLPASPAGSVQNLGDAVTKTTDTNPVGTKGAPTATPPGATPPVSSEPMKKLPTQPQETEGRKDLTDSEEEEEDSYEEIRDRIMGKRPTQTMHANPGALTPHQEETELESDETIDEDVEDLQELEVKDKDELKTNKSKVRMVKGTRYGGSAQPEEDEEEDEDKPGRGGAQAGKTRGTYNRFVDRRAKKTKEESVSMEEDINAMLAGENLSEEFKEKAATIFEAAVLARVQEITEQYEETFETQLEEAFEQLQEDMVEKIDNYLNYIVQEWMEENKLAVERGLRSQIVEDFMSGLKNLFVEHYIDIPDEKVDLVEELTNQIEDLESKLDEQIQRNIEIKKELDESVVEQVITKVCEGLTDTQAEKIFALAEGVEFVSEEDFLRKMVVIRENYFPSNKVVVQTQENLNEEIEITEEKEDRKLDPSMARYVQSLGKYKFK